MVGLYMFLHCIDYPNLACQLRPCMELRGVSHFYVNNTTGWLKKSKLLIFAVNEINASQTRFSFAKFIPKQVEKMFDMCFIVPNYSFSTLNFFIKILSSLLILPIITT